MKNSPLQLDRLVFTRVFVGACPEGNPKGEWVVRTSHQVVPKKNEPRKWFAALDVTIKPTGEAKPPYEVELQVVGEFHVAQSWPEGKISQLVGVNGCSMLFAAAREMVSNLTSRGPFPPLLLTSISFVDDFEPAAAPKKAE